MSYVSTVKNLLLIAEPVTGEFVGPLQQQPSVMAVDEQVRWPERLMYGSSDHFLSHNIN